MRQTRSVLLAAVLAAACHQAAHAALGAPAGAAARASCWDRLRPLVDWVEHGVAPDALIATHASDGVVDNERPICAYPERAVYTGPAGGADDPVNWVAGELHLR